MSAVGGDTIERLRRRRMEIFAFLFLTAVLMPALAIATVGSGVAAASAGLEENYMTVPISCLLWT